MRSIIELKLKKVGDRITEHYAAKLQYKPELVSAIAARCTEVDTGARNVDHILTKTLLPELSAAFLARMAEGGTIREAEIAVDGEGKFTYRVE
jgi:type VI secretion system protein VasG